MTIRRTLSLLLVAVCLAALQDCASLSPVDKVASAAIAASAGTSLGRISTQSLPAGESAGFRALPTSALAMDARLALTARAERTLDLQYYLVQDDATGRTWMREVRNAAARGVRVRLLVDDLYTAGSSRLLHELSAHDNVEVRVFNPFPAGRSLTLTRWGFSLLDFARINHRMHNKLFIADGAFAVAGGRNVADEYFFRSETGNFIDFDLLLAGAPVDRLASIFDTYWNSPYAYPLHALEPAPIDLPQLRSAFERRTASAGAAFAPLPPDTRDMLGNAPLSVDLAQPPVPLLHGAVQVFADDPQKVTGRSERGDDPDTVIAAAVRACDAATSELKLASPYVVPGKIGMDALRRARAHDVRTTLITNSLAANDEPFASAAYARYRKALLRMGVDIYEMSARPPAMAKRHGVQIAAVGRSHAKIAVIDARTTFIGSMNMDFRSSRENTELGVMVDSPALAAQVSGLLDELRDSDTYRLQLEQPGDRITWIETVDGVSTVHDDEPEVSPARRLKLFLFSPFVPEGLL
ncbi:phospholipase D family protein [Piscinibacter sp. XHJ-5]|uniref:phospholipase D family protein n=1 Tax=Piscinibacter sp. XHJ-5 TaxID=3037797 RepID=UPI0024533A18|nr:phospholipase D family protein [Piscinibacter sp. XHJ-5]